MPRKHDSAFGVVSCLVSLCFASIAAAQEARQPIYLHVNNVSVEDAKYSAGTGQGPIVDTLIYFESKHALADTLTRYEVIRAALPDFDMPAAYRKALGCLPSPIGKADCRDVVIFEAAAKQPDHEVVAPKGLITTVMLNIHYWEQWHRMVFDFMFEEKNVDEKSGQAPKRFFFKYIELVDSRADASPFIDPKSNTLTAAQTLARSYWFDGHPSRFETTLRAALEDFRSFAAVYYDQAGPGDVDVTKTSWYNGLPKFADLKAKGLIHCFWNACKPPYIRLENGRLWYVPESIPHIQMIESSPLSVWNR